MVPVDFQACQRGGAALAAGLEGFEFVKGSVEVAGEVGLVAHQLCQSGLIGEHRVGGLAVGIRRSAFSIRPLFALRRAPSG